MLRKYLNIDPDLRYTLLFIGFKQKFLKVKYIALRHAHICQPTQGYLCL